MLIKPFTAIANCEIIVKKSFEFLMQNCVKFYSAQSKYSNNNNSNSNFHLQILLQKQNSLPGVFCHLQGQPIKTHFIQVMSSTRQ